MAPYKSALNTIVPALQQSFRSHLMTSTTRPHLHKIIKSSPSQPATRNMSLLFPRFAYAAPVRCGGPARHEVAPLFSLFDDAFAEVTRASRHARKQWNPRFDIKETKDAYHVDAEIPGVDPKDVSVEFIDEHTLAIKGRSQRATEKGTKRDAVEAAPATTTEEATTTPASETNSVKSHQATVEDEEPANASAAQESAEVSKTAETEKAQEVAKTEEQQQPKEQYWFSERSVGSFQRQFAFPSRVDQEHVKASLKNGLLSIIVPKAPAPESRRIDIQ